MDNTYEINRNGLSTTIRIKDHAYDTIEFTVKKHLVEDGKTIIDSGYTCFFSSREFKDFFQPILNDLKVRIDDESRQPSNQ